MTQELIDLRTSILEGRYADALAIVDELEGMSKQAILRNIESFLVRILVQRVGDNSSSLAAVFGVYGCLALALILFTLREFVPEVFWNEKMVRFSFWAI